MHATYYVTSQLSDIFSYTEENQYTKWVKRESNLISSLYIPPKKTCFEKEKKKILACSSQSQKTVCRVDDPEHARTG